MPDGLYGAAEQVYKYHSNNQEESDSGEDFDYGCEDDDGESNNIDLMDYISNLDVSNFQGAVPK